MFKLDIISGAHAEVPHGVQLFVHIMCSVYSMVGWTYWASWVSHQSWVSGGPSLTLFRTQNRFSESVNVNS